mgnify:CR=1 FL=1
MQNILKKGQKVKISPKSTGEKDWIEGEVIDIEKNPFKGIGKPEPLKYQLSGLWSRRINLEHRLVYKVENSSIIILQCRYHA